MAQPIVKLWLSTGLQMPPEEMPYHAEMMNRMSVAAGWSHDQDAKFYARRNKYRMNEDDMTFMKEVFMPDDQGDEKPKLPFSKYIVQWGYHPLTMETYRTQGSDKTGALAEMRRKYGDHFQAMYQVPRPDGTLTKVSVISGMMFYSRKDEPYEVMVYAPGKEYDGPLPYQTDEQLMLLIAKLLGENDGLSK